MQDRSLFQRAVSPHTSWPMNESDVARIEHELSISLPDVYRQTIARFPFDAFRGSDDAPLFDDPDALIRLNREYHQGFAGMPAWPESLLFVGDDGAASTYAIDQSDPELSVVLLDHGHPDKVLKSCGSFISWLDHLHTEFDGSGFQQSPPIAVQRIFVLSLITIVVASAVGYALSRLVL